MSLNFFFFGMPPPISKIISRKVVPIGTSTNPVLTTLPTREKILVPLLCSVPIEEYHWAPRLIITGTLAHVSTLLRFEGFWRNPFSTVWMYLARGSPTRPSSVWTCLAARPARCWCGRARRTARPPVLNAADFRAVCKRRTVDWRWRLLLPGSGRSVDRCRES